jgi:peptidoglycan hydrolase-like protein with peptidoglycan-binding domain
MPTPVHSPHRSPKAILLLLAAIFAVGAAAPSAEAGSASRAPALTALAGLHPGEQGPAVKKLQRMLAGLGYPVKPDGQFGPHTATMVRTLRADVGLDRSARVTKRFLKAVKRAQRGGPGDRRWLGIRRLRVGTQGQDVKILQSDLTQLGFPAASDGAFGPATRTSVRMFERAAGLRVDGVLTPRDVRALKKAVKSGGMAGAVSLRTTRSSTTAAATAPGTTPAEANQPTGQTAPAAPAAATIGANGLAIPPPGAPAAVVAIIQAGNVIAHMPYRFGGGHQSWQDTGYDCSGSVSYALHGAGLVDSPLASYDFYTWGEAGPGQWVTVYAKDSHAYMVVAGLRYDTAASKGGGSRWTAEARAPDGYVARHPAGL